MKTLGLLSLLVTTFLYSGDLDDALGGFDEGEKIPLTTQADPVTPSSNNSWLELSGAYTFSTAVNYIPEARIPGISRLRNKLDLTFDMTLAKNWKSKIEFKTQYDPVYALRELKDYTESLEYLSEIKEAYILGSMGSFDLKIGRQIVVWGKSDSIRITDVINPLDNREPGMVDIEDLRLAVAMSKLSYYLGPWSLSMMAIHESRVQYEAGIDSEFFPTSIFPFPPNFVFPDLVTPESSLANTQYAASIDGRFSGWDLSLYAAEVLDQRWHLVGTPPSSREYNKIKMSGLAFNMALGNWLVKTEAAYLGGLIYNTTSLEKDRFDFLFGLDYMGITDLVLSLEWANRHLFDYESQMLEAADFVRQDEVTTAFRASYTFDHDNATLSYLLSRFGPQLQDGGFQRLWMSYKFNDSVLLTSGLIDYMASEGQKPFFDAIVNNDRIFFDVKYSF